MSVSSSVSIVHNVFYCRTSLFFRIDSILLLEEGFRVTSTDASDRMLKYALKARWNRRTEPGFEKWVIEEANWLSLPDDLIKSGDGTKIDRYLLLYNDSSVKNKLINNVIGGLILGLCCRFGRACRIRRCDVSG